MFHPVYIGSNNKSNLRSQTSASAPAAPRPAPPVTYSPLPALGVLLQNPLTSVPELLLAEAAVFLLRLVGLQRKTLLCCGFSQQSICADTSISLIYFI